MSERTRRLLGVCGDRFRGAATSCLAGAVVAALSFIEPSAAVARQNGRRARTAATRLAPSQALDAPAAAPDASSSNDDAWQRVLVEPPGAAAWDAAAARDLRLGAWSSAASSPTFRRTARRAAQYSLAIPDGEAAPLLQFAAGLLGSRYRFGSDDGEFDCSGFVRHVFGEFGVELPHSSRAQFTLGDVVDRYELEPGDLVFFRSARGRRVNHVGIYVGDHQFVHAARHEGRVTLSSLTEAYYDRTFVGARRIDL